jgi:hypothetical protein
MGWTCKLDGRDKICTQNFGNKTFWKADPWKNDTRQESTRTNLRRNYSCLEYSVISQMAIIYIHCCENLKCHKLLENG